MNRQVHLIIGVGLFLVYLYVTGLFHGPTGELFVFGIIAVTAGSLFPDIMEPARSPRHRRIFHSRRALNVAGVLFLLTGVTVMFARGIPDPAPVFAFSCFFLGYAAHLLADSVTRAGLPG
jgi:membrane-bound metal-dependent hydrolase YbcI (DUF457 family)